MADWIIYYDNGQSFTSENGNPEDAPREGVLVVAQKDSEVGRRIYWDFDYYCWQRGQWVPHDRWQCERYMNITKHPVRLCGYWVRPDLFKAAMKEALSDNRLPMKTAKHQQEIAAGIYKWLPDK